MNREFENLQRSIDRDLSVLSERLAVEMPSGLEARLQQSVRSELARPVIRTTRRSGWVMWSATAAAAAIAVITSLPLPLATSATSREAAEEWGMWVQAFEDSQGAIATALDENTTTDSWTADERDIEAYLESYDLWMGAGT